MTFCWFFIIFIFGGSPVLGSDRIVGGDETTITEHPSLVQVEFLSLITNVWSQSCGGNVLTARYILSAAQCFSGWNFDAPYRRIRAGTTYRQVGGVVLYIEKAINHPSYGLNGLDGDISVVRLRDSLTYSPSIQQATIVTHGSVILDNSPVVHAGWGRVYSGGPHSEILRSVTVYTVNHDICAERYSGLPINITNNMICAGILDLGGRDACHDDSGGPMYFDDVIIGIISGGLGCAEGQYPSISTAVGSYTDWIVGSAI